MPNDDLKIIVQGLFDKDRTADDLNKQLKRIQNKLDRVNVKINLDDKITKTLNDFSKAMEKSYQLTQDLSRAYKEEETVLKKLDGTTEKVTRKFLKNGEIIEKTKKIVNEKTKSAISDAKQESNEVRKLGNEYKKYGEEVRRATFKDGAGNIQGFNRTFDDGKSTRTFSMDGSGNVQREQIVENLRARKQALETEKRKTEQLKQQLSLYKQQQAINVQTAKRRYDGLIDNKALDNHLKKVNQLSHTTPKVQHQMREFAMGFKQIEANAKTAAGALDTGNRSALSFGSAMKTALIKFPIWIASASLIYAPIRAFSDAVRQIIEIDTQLTELMRVSNGQENINKVLSESIRLADELGNKVTNLNTAIIGFSRQGFRGDDLIAISEVATLMSNVSTLSLEESMSGVTAAMKVFNIEASESIKIVNSLNEVDNNFSIETAQLSDAIKKAGGAARAFGKLKYAA
jgi:hypothetical protein